MPQGSTFCFKHCAKHNLALKNKYNKGGDETKFQGTMLGNPIDYKAIAIEGSLRGGIEAWEKAAKQLGQSPPPQSVASQSVSSLPSSPVSSPLSEV